MMTKNDLWFVWTPFLTRAGILESIAFFTMITIFEVSYYTKVYWAQLSSLTALNFYFFTSSSHLIFWHFSVDKIFRRLTLSKTCPMRPGYRTKEDERLNQWHKKMKSKWTLIVTLEPIEVSWSTPLERYGTPFCDCCLPLGLEYLNSHCHKSSLWLFGQALRQPNLSHKHQGDSNCVTKVFESLGEIINP